MILAQSYHEQTWKLVLKSQISLKTTFSQSIQLEMSKISAVSEIQKVMKDQFV